MDYRKSEYNDIIQSQGESIRKLYLYQDLYIKWIGLKQRNVRFDVFFQERNYNKVAIYGFRGAGELFYDELKNSSVRVVEIIDQNADYIYAEIPSRVKEEMSNEADVIVVTALFSFPNIEEDLRKITEIPIIPLNDIVDSLWMIEFP